MRREARLKVDPEVVRHWQRRRRPIRPVSPRKRKWLREYAEARVTVLSRAEGFCEAWLVGCETKAVDVHHLKGRVGPDANLPENLRALCRNCHERIHRNPNDAYRVGLMIRRVR